MDKGTLKQYKSLQRESPRIEKKLEKLYERWDKIPVVKIKVTKSGDSFPYIEEHLSVLEDEPRESDEVDKQIRLYELRLDEAERMQWEIEKFIAGIKDSETRMIFELRFLEGKGLYDIAAELEVDRSTIGKRITNYFL